MHYFIDGYNVIFRYFSSQDNLQNSRTALIHLFNDKAALLGLDISIVFDAMSQPEEEGRKSHYAAVEILYTKKGESADEYILNALRLSSNTRNETVVTSDKKLAAQARGYSAHTESVEDFMHLLKRLARNKVKQSKVKQEKPPLPSSILQKSSVPPLKDVSLDSCSTYYEQIFESKWQELVKQEEEKAAASSLSSSAVKKRTPKKKKKSIPSTLPSERKEASDMERWLNVFEKRLHDFSADME